MSETIASDEAAIAVRDATDADIPAIAEIYGHHVRCGLGTFEETPPSPEEMRQRHADILARGLPWLVAVDRRGRVLGYAYAAPYRLRSAYRYTLEDSIYVAPQAQRRGIGRTLLQALVARCTALGFRQMIAVIGDSVNAASIGLHARAGFERIGILAAVGYKQARWVDAVLMQRPLGDGAGTPPEKTPP